MLFLKKKILYIHIFFFIIISFLWEYSAHSLDRAFTKNEYYKYRMDWLGIPVGYVTFEINPDYKLNGQDVYLIVMTVRTNKFASAIYRIYDTYTSYVDKKSLLPIRHDVDRQDGTYRKRATTYFNRIENKAYFENFLDHSKKIYNIPPDVLDPISCVLKIRSLGIKIGDNYHLKVSNNEQIYDIYGYVEKKKRIKVDGFGEYDAFYVSPYAVLNGVRYKKGTVYGYFSDDENSILLFAEGKASIFSIITANLIEKNIT